MQITRMQKEFVKNKKFRRITWLERVTLLLGDVFEDFRNMWLNIPTRSWTNFSAPG